MLFSVWQSAFDWGKSSFFSLFCPRKKKEEEGKELDEKSAELLHSHGDQRQKMAAISSLWCNLCKKSFYSWKIKNPFFCSIFWPLFSPFSFRKVAKSLQESIKSRRFVTHFPLILRGPYGLPPPCPCYTSRKARSPTAKKRGAGNNFFSYSTEKKLRFLRRNNCFSFSGGFRKCKVTLLSLSHSL